MKRMNFIKRTIASFFILVLMVGFSPINSIFLAVNSEDNLIINNIFSEELAIVIAQQLNKPVDAQVTREELESIKLLSAMKSGISDLNGIQLLTNLEELHLNENNISDITPLSNLQNLWALRLSDNNVSDVGPLSGLQNLKELYVTNNKLTNIDNLTDLPSLTELLLLDNEIENIDCLKNANFPSLISLNLENNNIKDITGLADLTSLRNLQLSNNQIEDISTLALLPDLFSITLAENNISNIDCLKQFDSEKYYSLDLSGNQIVDISSVSNLKNIISINLNDNKISDIKALENLGNLKYLKLENNKINDIGVLATLSNLDNAFLSNNNIVDFSSYKDGSYIIIAENQTYSFEDTYIGKGKITIENPIKYLSKDFLESLPEGAIKQGGNINISNISHGGIYNEEENTITWNNLKGTENLTFDFNIEEIFTIKSPVFNGFETVDIEYDFTPVTINGTVTVPCTAVKPNPNSDDVNNVFGLLMIVSILFIIKIFIIKKSMLKIS